MVRWIAIRMWLGLLGTGVLGVGCARAKAIEGDSLGECSDMQDNDSNDLIDCDDPGCKDSPECDGDGLIDSDGDGSPDDEDCAPNNPDVSPDLEEIPYDGANNDCDPDTPDDDLDGDGHSLVEDCDDLDATVNPRAAELPYDGIDNDCNGATPEDDLDGDGLGIADDCDDGDGTVGGDAASECLASPLADVRLLGSRAEWALGSAVSIVGDIDGDGVVEVAVGARGTERSKGAVWLLSGDALLDGESLHDAAIAAWMGEVNYDYVGDAGLLSGAGDLDGDGLADILVGHPNSDPGGFGNVGEVAVMLSTDAASWAVDALLVDQASVRIQGRANADKLGTSVVSVDVSGDGVLDLVVASPQDDAGLDNAGALLVFEGPFASGTTRSATDADGLVHGAFGETLGFGALALVGDVDADGQADLAVGSTTSDGPEVDTGVVYVVSLAVLSDGAMADLALARIEGREYDDRLGEGIAGALDADSDGVNDLVVGALLGDGATTNAGSAALFYGGASISGVLGLDDADLEWSGPTGLSRSGAAPVSGNLDGTGGGDLLLSEPYGASGGRVYGLLSGDWVGGDPARDASVWISSGIEDAIGLATALGDIDNNGVDDIVVGAPEAMGPAGELAGEVAIFLR